MRFTRSKAIIATVGLALSLAACGDAGDGSPHVTAPQGLIDWLAYNTGAIYVEN